MIRGFFDTILVGGYNVAFDMTCESLSRNVKRRGRGNEDPSKKKKSNEMLRK